MKKRITWLLTFVILIYTISGCTPGARYERRLKHELASGVRYDSLFMGIYLGMPMKDFYTHCWKLNKKGLIRQGSNNATVEYNMGNELKYPATMNFYPTFSQGKISEMPVTFKYAGWAPWNRALSSENLELDVLKYYKKLYGGGFITIRHHQYGNAYVKVDGNRRISIFKNDELTVYAIFTDMLAKKDLISPSPVEKNQNDTLRTPGKKQNE